MAGFDNDTTNSVQLKLELGAYIVGSEAEVSKKFGRLLFMPYVTI